MGEQSAKESGCGRETVCQCIEQVVAGTPEAPCLIAGESTWSYRDLWLRSGRMAATFRQAGVSPGDRIAAMVDKSAHAVALYLACLRAGAVYLPLNPGYRDLEATYVLEDAAPRMLVTRSDRAGGLEPALGPGARIFTLESNGSGSLAGALDPSEATDADPARKAADPAAILYTSGTTGKPKGVVLSHGNLATNADVLVAAWRFTSDDVLLHALPIFHVHGLFVALHCALFAGAAIRLLDRFEAATVVRHLPGATVFMGVPTFYSRMLENPALATSCSAMRLFTSGSAPLSPSTHAAFAARTGHPILERYGMTEAGMITSNPYQGNRVAGSVGYPLPGVETRVVGDDGSLCARGDVGVLEIRGPNVFTGYWRRPETDRETFRDGWLVTGDLVRVDPDGRVWIVGRAKDLIISGGMNVYPAEVENAVEAVPGTAACAVIGLPHPDFGEAVVAVMERGAGSRPTAQEIEQVLHTRLAGYKCPKRILFVEELPRNAMGKVQKAVLRRRFAALFRDRA